jgi:hypothetical protein
VGSRLRGDGGVEVVQHIECRINNHQKIKLSIETRYFKQKWLKMPTVISFFDLLSNGIAHILKRE